LIFLVRILVVCANADMSASGLADIPYVAFDVAFGGKADMTFCRTCRVALHISALTHSGHDLPRRTSFPVPA
jgi:hypothetical protein